MRLDFQIDLIPEAAKPLSGIFRPGLR